MENTWKKISHSLFPRFLTRLILSQFQYNLCMRVTIKKQRALEAQFSLGMSKLLTEHLSLNLIKKKNKSFQKNGNTSL